MKNYKHAKVLFTSYVRLLDQIQVFDSLYGTIGIELTMKRRILAANKT